LSQKLASLKFAFDEENTAATAVAAASLILRIHSLLLICVH
jgi:hypothetical protein